MCVLSKQAYFPWLDKSPFMLVFASSFKSYVTYVTLQGATFVYEALLAPVVKILRREIAKNPSLDKSLNGALAQGAVSPVASAC